jgi:AraC-like DNA-binding protein
MEREAYWVDLICGHFVGLECDPPTDTKLYGELGVAQLGSMTVANVRSNALHIRRTPNHIRSESDSYYLVQIQRRGTGVVAQDGRSAVLQPGDFALHDSTRPYELTFEESGHEVTTLRLPCSVLDAHVANLHELTATTIAAAGPSGHLLGSMVSTLERDFECLTPAATLSIGEAVTSIIAAGLKGLPAANARRPSSLTAYHVARVKRYVQEHLRDPGLSVASAARALNVSSDHLARVFKNEPMPLCRFISSMRLAACKRDLADPRLTERTVSEIAYSWGFSDPVHFSRAFREYHGMSPREWRHVTGMR